MAIGCTLTRAKKLIRRALRDTITSCWRIAPNVVHRLKAVLGAHDLDEAFVMEVEIILLVLMRRSVP